MDLDKNSQENSANSNLSIKGEILDSLRISLTIYSDMQQDLERKVKTLFTISHKYNLGYAQLSCGEPYSKLIAQTKDNWCEPEGFSVSKDYHEELILQDITIDLEPMFIFSEIYRLDAIVDNKVGLHRIVNREHMVPSKMLRTTYYCDYCGENKLNDYTFIFYSEAKGYKRISSSCLDSFLKLTSKQCIAAFNSIRNFTTEVPTRFSWTLQERKGNMYNIVVNRAVMLTIIRDLLLSEGLIQREYVNGIDFGPDRIRSNQGMATNDKAIARLLSSTEEIVADQLFVAEFDSYLDSLDLEPVTYTHYYYNTKIKAFDTTWSRNTKDHFRKLKALQGKEVLCLKEVFLVCPAMNRYFQMKNDSVTPVSQWIGSVGRKQDLSIIIVDVTTGKSAFGKYYKLWTFEDEQKNVLIKFGELPLKFRQKANISGDLLTDGIRKGDLFTFTGVIKEHQTKKGQKITRLENSIF